MKHNNLDVISLLKIYFLDFYFTYYFIFQWLIINLVLWKISIINWWILS